MSSTINQHDLYVLPLAVGASRFDVLPAADERISEIDQEVDGALFITFESPTSSRDLYLRLQDDGKWKVKRNIRMTKAKDVSTSKRSALEVVKPTHGRFHFSLRPGNDLLQGPNIDLGRDDLTMEQRGIVLEAYNNIWNRRNSDAHGEE